jgi:hypothetical protein
MLLPEGAFGIKRVDSRYVMLGPAALPYLCPPLGCLSRIHRPTLDKGTDKRPGQQDAEQLMTADKLRAARVLLVTVSLCLGPGEPEGHADGGGSR